MPPLCALHCRPNSFIVAQTPACDIPFTPGCLSGVFQRERRQRARGRRQTHGAPRRCPAAACECAREHVKLAAARGWWPWHPRLAAAANILRFPGTLGPHRLTCRLCWQQQLMEGPMEVRARSAGEVFFHWLVRALPWVSENRRAREARRAQAYLARSVRRITGNLPPPPSPQARRNGHQA